MGFKIVVQILGYVGIGPEGSYRRRFMFAVYCSIMQFIMILISILQTNYGMLFFSSICLTIFMLSAWAVFSKAVEEDYQETQGYKRKNSDL